MTHRTERRALPHARGGGPRPRAPRRSPAASSPRTWGWTGGWRGEKVQGGLFPTHVGVDPIRPCCSSGPGSLPHARGGGPPTAAVGNPNSNSSPRTWGWTADRQRLADNFGLFPTHVGVDRTAQSASASDRALPHARGGGPARKYSTFCLLLSSPRTWGWTPTGSTPPAATLLFPTHVGVDRCQGAGLLGVEALPHARGGGPVSLAHKQRLTSSSPRTWGWTVGPHLPRFLEGLFPTHVGVDRRSAAPSGWAATLPHARGGGPTTIAYSSGVKSSSPRTWGWTVAGVAAGIDGNLFPTHVGVDRRARQDACASRSLPHARGGGPIIPEDSRPPRYSSPRTWGWTPTVSRS